MNPEETPTNNLVPPSGTPPLAPPPTDTVQLQPSTPPPEKKKHTALIVLLTVIILLSVGVFSIVTFFLIRSIASDNLGGTSWSSMSSQNQYFASCVYFDKLPQPNLEFKDKSDPGQSCRFILQFEGLGDTPVAVGEVFTGDYSWNEVDAFVPEGLERGFELDLLDLGLLRTGKGQSMNVIERREFTAGGQRAVLYLHESNRSITGQAYSVAIQTPTSLVLDGTKTAALFIWGVSSTQNGNLLEDLVSTLQWVDTKR